MGRGRKQPVGQGETGRKLGVGHEHTQNIPRMPVTLKVSNVSGWLNAVACCRVREREAYGAERGAGRGMRTLVAGAGW